MSLLSRVDPEALDAAGGGIERLGADLRRVGESVRDFPERGNECLWKSTIREALDLMHGRLLEAQVGVRYIASRLGGLSIVEYAENPLGVARGAEYTVPVGGVLQLRRVVQYHEDPIVDTTRLPFGILTGELRSLRSPTLPFSLVADSVRVHGRIPLIDLAVDASYHEADAEVLEVIS